MSRTFILTTDYRLQTTDYRPQTTFLYCMFLAKGPGGGLVLFFRLFEVSKQAWYGVMMSEMWDMVGLASLLPTADSPAISKSGCYEVR